MILPNCFKSVRAPMGTSRAASALAVLALVAPLSAQFEARESKTVPPVFLFPSGSTFAESPQGQFSIVVETSYLTPGVGFRIRDHANTVWTSRKRMFKNLLSTGREPTVVIVDDEVFLCWVERVLTRTGIEATLYTTKSNKGATTWDAPRRMNAPSGLSNPAIVDYSVVSTIEGKVRRIYIASLWVDDLGRNREILLARSTDGGDTFTNPVRIATTSQGRPLEQVRLVTETDRVHVAWLEDRARATFGQVDVFHRALEHAKTVPGTETRVTSTPFTPSPDGLVLATDANAATLAWLQSNAAQRDTLLVAASTDSGQTFTKPVIVGSYRPGIDDVSNPAVMIDKSRTSAAIAWSDDRNSERRVRVAGLDLRSGAVGTEQSVFAFGSDEPLLIRDGDGKILLNVTIPRGVRSSFSEDGGMTWSGAIPMLEVERGKTVETKAASYDPKKRAFNFAWQVQDAPGLAFGGIRPQSVGLDTATGHFNAGSRNRFCVSSFPANLKGMPFQILLSTGLGSTRFRSLDTVVDLKLDALFMLSFQLPALRGILDANGAGCSGSIEIPYSLLGQKFYFVALAIDFNGPAGIVTDPRLRVVQDDLLRAQQKR